MLRFHTAPDPIFLELLHSAIEMTIDDLADSSELDDSKLLDIKILLPLSSRFFTAQEAREQLLILRQSLAAEEWFKPRSHHWLLLYEALQSYCALFNNGPFGTLAEDHSIKQVELKAVVDVFFWDTDFLDANRPQETRGLVTHMKKPHPNELVLIPCASIENSTVSGFFIPGSKEYPSSPAAVL